MAASESSSASSSVMETVVAHCPKSIAIGTTIGAVLGGGFHALQGPTQVTIGQPDLKAQRLGAMRIGGIFGLYTTVRCVMEHNGMGASAPFWAGGLAVAIPHAVDPARTDFLRDYVKDAVKMPMGRGLAIGMAAFSGSIVLGSADKLLHALGANW